MNETHPESHAASARVPLDAPVHEALLALYIEPLLAASRARARRDALFGRRVHVQHRRRMETPDVAAISRGDEMIALSRWPAPATLQDGDHVVVQVDADHDGRERWLRWLAELGATDRRIALAPCSRTAAGLHPLWCIAVARLASGPTTHVVARHDLLGVRLAQVALGFGADVLAGPIDPDRSLPLCGVPRPDETTLAGLSTLVRHAGLIAVADAAPEEAR
jgi:hypothetical protein